MVGLLTQEQEGRIHKSIQLHKKCISLRTPQAFCLQHAESRQMSCGAKAEHFMSRGENIIL
jgi:hypothetical protein